MAKSKKKEKEPPVNPQEGSVPVTGIPVTGRYRPIPRFGGGCPNC